MAEKIERRQNYWLEHPAIALFLFTALIFVIRVFLRSQTLELDEAEQVVMAQELLPGYPNQPPFYSWLQYGFFKILGVNLISLALLKSTLLFGCYYVFHQICRLHCQSVLLAWCATLSWAFIPAISLDLLKDNTHSILALLSVCLTWYWFIAPPRLSKTSWYLIFGCIIGVGFLSKFNYFFFFIILLCSAISIDEYRNKLMQRGMLLTLLVAFSIASPYLVWLFYHPDVGLYNAYKLVPQNKQQWEGIIQLIKASVFFVSPVLIIAFLFFPLNRWIKQRTAANHLLSRYHAISLPFLAIVILVAGLRDFETRWLIPILFLCPVLYFSQVKPSDKLVLRAKYFLILCLVIQLTLLLTLIYRSHNKQKIRNQFPLNQVVQTLKNDLAVDYIVSDSYWLLGNLLTQLPTKAGWLLRPGNEYNLPKGRLVFIWQSAQPPYWVAYFAKLYSLGEIKLIEDPKNNNAVVAGRAYLASSAVH